MASDPVTPFDGLDPTRNFIISAFGVKGSGKTTVARMIYRSYPYAKLCIDVNGDADPGPASKIIRSPRRHMPEHRDREPWPDLHYIADPGADNYADQLDAAVGMSLYPQDQLCLVWCDEVGEFTTATRTGPNLRRLLQQSRHYRTSAIFSGPRPVDIDKLVIFQSDLVFVFYLPDPKDQDRIANNIGWEPARFRRTCQECWSRGEYCHLVYDRRTKTMFDCDPLDV